jgi:superfamily II DNA/RNA helicase
MVESYADQKALTLIYMLKERSQESSLCFASNLETTHRLYLLLKEFDLSVAEFSSTLTQSERNQILADFHDGKIKV